MRSEPARSSIHPLDRAWLVDDFDYDLPPHLVAQEPLSDRAASRLMVVRPGGSTFIHSSVRELGRWLRPGDLLVANNSRVIPARLRASRAGTGGRVELLLLRRLLGDQWEALARPARRLRAGVRLIAEPHRSGHLPALAIEVEEVGTEGKITVRLEGSDGFDLADYGTAPLPPYITTPLKEPNRYQTVYARNEGSAAAPTAGLHFTPDLISSLQANGIGWAEVTLHVGLDTFRPVTVERADQHTIHREWCSVPDETVEAIVRTQQTDGRVIAIGTTSARTVEYLGQRWDAEHPSRMTGMADLFITPGHRWSVVDGLLTNFHLPRSTLLMMVSALAGVETVRAAYAEAIASEYRFYSFGDAMLILPRED